MTPGRFTGMNAPEPQPGVRAAPEAANTGTPLPERTPAHLLPQVQHQPQGPFMARECLVPPDAGSVAFAHLGDMRLRFVFDQPGTGGVAVAHAQDLARLGLTPARAMAQALANLRGLGAPAIVAQTEGVQGLRAPHAAYAAALLLDRGFWRQQLARSPQGLVAAVPARGMLLFAPAGDAAAVQALVRQAARARAAAGPAGISAWLYRFDAGGWTPHAPLPGPPQARPAREAGAPLADAAPAGADVDDDEDAGPEAADAQDLDKAASGQKMLIASIAANLVLNAAARAGLPPVASVALVLLLGAFSLLGVVRLCTGLGKSTALTVGCMVLSFFPVLNLGVWLLLSMQATRALRAAGWRVGLLGARS